jgi:nucleoside-diphosphate-sugar epimerase
MVGCGASVMTFLVTGASGFVGSWLTAALAADGLPVIAQMRGAPSALFARLNAGPHVVVCSDADIAAVIEAHQPTTVFHLAGMSQIGEANQNPVFAYTANAQTTWVMLDALRRMAHPARTVIASTDSLYGETGGSAAKETDPLRATGPYETSKLMAELAARSFSASYGLPVTIARLGNVYGAGDANSARIIPAVIAALSKSSVPHLRGGGRAVRSLLHVQDCITGLRMLGAVADRPDVRGEAFNLSGTPPLTTAEIARIALNALGREDVHPIITDDAPGETSVKFSDSSKLRDRLGWEPKWTLDAGLRDIRETWGTFQ